MYNIQACQFVRTQDSEWEVGILIDEGTAILDKDCKVVGEVWDYHRTPSVLCIGVGHIFEQK